MTPFQIRVKSDDVNLQGHPRLMHGLVVLCETIYDVTNGRVIPVITSVWDQTHGENSLHYIGCAGDVRSHYLNDEEKQQVLDQARAELGREYDLLLEGWGSPNEHFHIEWDVGKHDRVEAIREALGAK